MPDPITTMNISLPTSYRDFIQKRMEKGGFTNASEYIRHLIRQDHKAAESERIDELLLEGLNSGPGIPLTRDFIDDLKRRARAKAAEIAKNPKKDGSRKAG